MNQGKEGKEENLKQKGKVTITALNLTELFQEATEQDNGSVRGGKFSSPRKSKGTGRGIKRRTI